MNAGGMQIFARGAKIGKHK